MKKVGILTLPLNDNYGGMLQAVALYGFLSQQGYEVVFLKNEYFKKKWKALVWSAIARIPFQNLKGVRYSHRKKIFHESFLKTNITNRSRSLSSTEDFQKVANQEQFDAVIVGSDQVWRWDYILDGFERYFLNFIDGKKTRKIAYAASFGKPHWQAPDQSSTVSKLLSDFHSISTRESDAIAICQGLGGQNCKQVIDPTLLVGRSFYDKFLIKSDRTPGKKTLLTYVLDEQNDKLEFIRQINQSLGMDYETRSLVVQEYLTVPAWVSAFHDADFVITDSFHGMVFSLLFNKQFIVIGNSNRGVSRFTSLLQQLELNHRLIDENNLSLELANESVHRKIDYLEINSKLEVLRNSSSDFLINAITS
jgi:serine/threonine protein kinase